MPDDRSAQPARSINRRTALAAAGALLLTGCATNSAGSAPSNLGVLRVGTLPVPDTAPLELAVRTGLFARAGLKVDLVPTALTGDQKVDLNSGDVNVLFDSYPSHFQHYAFDNNVQLVADAFQANDHTSALITQPGARFRRVTDLTSGRIGVNDLHGIGVLLTSALLDAHGVGTGAVRFVEMPFDGMQDALANNVVDAAWLIEPYITQMKMAKGLQTISSTTTGVTSDFPQSGYVCSRSWARRNATALNAFVGALDQANALANSRPSAVVDVLPSYTGIKPQVATLMAQGSYPTTLSPVRLQRVADLMFDTHELPARFDVRTMMP